MLSTERFSSRAEDYRRYRPSYPAELIHLLQSELSVNRSSRVADVGSGTGLLTELFLNLGCTVFAVEPNADMRTAAEGQLSGRTGFHSVEGTAEATGLAGASVDLVAAGQAFHWFDPVRTRTECQRILRPGGALAIVWNTRLERANPFLLGFEDLLRTSAPEYLEATHRRIGDDVLNAFFGPAGFRYAVLPNRQVLDWDGLLGRVRSVSYIPAAGTPAYEALVTGLRALFDRTCSGGKAVFLYETQVYYGKQS